MKYVYLLTIDEVVMAYEKLHVMLIKLREIMGMPDDSFIEVAVIITQELQNKSYGTLTSDKYEKDIHFKRVKVR